MNLEFQDIAFGIPLLKRLVKRNKKVLLLGPEKAIPQPVDGKTLR